MYRDFNTLSHELLLWWKARWQMCGGKQELIWSGSGSNVNDLETDSRMHLNHGLWDGVKDTKPENKPPLRNRLSSSPDWRKSLLPFIMGWNLQAPSCQTCLYTEETSFGHSAPRLPLWLSCTMLHETPTIEQSSSLVSALFPAYFLSIFPSSYRILT